MASFLDPLRRQGAAATFSLTNTRSGRVVAPTLLTAFDSESRRRGLLTRDSLDDDCALIIAPSSAVHTVGMRFAIDIAFVSLARAPHSGAICSSAPGWRRRMRSASSARAATASSRPSCSASAAGRSFSRTVSG